LRRGQREEGEGREKEREEKDRKNTPPEINFWLQPKRAVSDAAVYWWDAAGDGDCWLMNEKMRCQL